MKRLSKETIKAIENLQIALENDIENAQAYFDERTEKWQESEKGEDFQAWIENLQTAKDALDEIEYEPS